MVSHTPTRFARARIRGVHLCLALTATGGLAAGCASGASTPTNDPVLIASVDSLVLNLESPEIIIGDTLRLAAIAINAQGIPVPGIQLLWTTSDPSIATVSATGLVNAVSFGEAEIAVEVAGAAVKGGASALRQKGARSRSTMYSVPNLVITPTNGSTDVPGTIQYSASLTNSRNVVLSISPAIKWASSAPAVATISNTGLATAVDQGTSLVTATVTSVLGRDAQPRSVPLKVEFCGGLLKVDRWTATVKSGWNVLAETSAYKFNIDQSSSGTAILHPTTTTGSSNGNRTQAWEGTPIGTARITNKGYQWEDNETGGFFRLDETEDGAAALNELALVQLQVTRTVADGCSFTLSYEDTFGYRHSDLGLGGITISEINFAGFVEASRTAGTKPTGGWRLEAPDGVSDVDVLPDASLALGSKAYQPGPAIPSLFLQILPPATWGKARFSYTLVPQ